MFSRRNGRVTPDVTDAECCHPNKTYFSDSDSPTDGRVENIGGLTDNSARGHLKGERRTSRYQNDDLLTSTSSGSGLHAAECDVTEDETNLNYLDVNIKETRSSVSPANRKSSLDIRRKHRLPSTANYIMDPETGNYRLPDCQKRHEKLFARTLVQLRKRQLLPSYERNIADGKHGNGFRLWKRSKKESCARWKCRRNSVASRLELWQESIKCIEGSYGSGVVAYFLFLKWLFILNLIVCLLLAIFVVVPQICFSEAPYSNTTDGATDERVNQSLYCSAHYNVSWSYADKHLLALDFLQGTGWMEKTILFYGYYSDSKLYIGTWDDQSYYYYLPQAYIIVTSIVLAISLASMAKRTAVGFRVIILESEQKRSRYANMILGSWDYTLNVEKMVKRKYNSLHQEIMVVLVEDDELNRRSKRTARDYCLLFSVRLLINIFVLITLAASGYSIYQAAQQSLQFRQRYDYDDINTLVQLLMEYLPSLTVTILNAMVPPLFNVLVKGEDYCPEFEIQVTLGRTVFLRLASLAVLLGTLYSQVTCPVKDTDCNVGISPDCSQFWCWETYVGQQVYKLVILDFFVVLAKVFLVDFPRRAIVSKYNCKLTRMIGRAQFRIPQEVLDLVYSQILCWLGLFFSPLTPAICAVKFVIVFYLKKLTCIYNLIPPTRPFRASKSQLFFTSILLAAFILCCIPIGYIIFKIPPSKGCGPFRIYDAIFHVVTITISRWPIVVGQISEFITSPVFILPFCVLLIILVYYYSAVASARKRMLNLMREQLLMEGHDKKYLLVKLNELSGS